MTHGKANWKTAPKRAKKLKEIYRLKVAQFRIKVRNIAGDEIIYDYNGKKLSQVV